MEEFKVRRNGFEEIKKDALKRGIPITVVAALAGICIPLINSDDGGDRFFSVLPFILPILAGALILGFYLGLKRQRKMYDSYILRIDNSGVARVQSNTPLIQLKKDEIRAIQRMPKGAFVIKGTSEHDSILIPAQMEDRDRMEIALESLAPISAPEPTSIWARLNMVFVLLVLVSMVIACTATDKIVVAIAGLFLTVTLIWSLIVMQKNKNIDRNTKIAGFWVLLVLISITSVVILKIWP